MTPRRVHAFEFNEREGVPRFVRDGIVEALGTGLRWGRIYEGVGPVFAEFLERSKAGSVLDLCSGSGEPVAIFLDALARAGVRTPTFAVSDLFPNEPSFDRVAARYPGRIEVVRKPVDATDVPPDVDRPARTVISAFHHFSPELARRILADCVAKRRAVFIVEGMTRSLFRLAAILPSMTAAAIANPFLAGRDRLAKALGTFLVPAIPVAGLWDAVVSALRIHTEAELRAMVEPLGQGYAWEYREVPFFPGGRAAVFFGIPPA